MIIQKIFTGIDKTARCTVLASVFVGGTVLAAPYPASPVLDGVTWDFTSHKQSAPGSDLWPVTWADDGNLYTSWGDGGGFTGTGTVGRVTVGVARIAGTPDNLQAKNVFGGANTLSPATFDGKSNGILSVNGTLYLSLTEEGAWLRGSILSSTDHGQSWSGNIGTTWDFQEADGAFSDMTFLQFGRDYQGARDNFVYVYSQDKRASKPRTTITMFRTPTNAVRNKAQYEYFAGLDNQGNPQWTSDITARAPVFTDTNGIGFGVRVTYVAGLNRYLLTKWRDVEDGTWGIYDAPEPWGPWTTVVEYGAGSWIDGTKKFGFTFPTKWISPDGLNFVMVFSGPSFDYWNTIKGSFVLKNTTPPPPPPTEVPTTPSGININVN